MAKLYSITIRWIKTPATDDNAKRMAAAVGQAGDWIRLSVFSWFLWSEYTSTAIAEHLRAQLHPEDSIVIVAVDPNDASGWAPKWVWDWIAQKAENAKQPALGGLFAPGLQKPQF